jgi:hypothetical protein
MAGSIRTIESRPVQSQGNRNAGVRRKPDGGVQGLPDEDIRVRGYLALILGKLQAHAAVPLLLDGLLREEKLKTKQWEGTGVFQLIPPPLSEISEDLIRSQISVLWRWVLLEIMPPFLAFWSR